MSSTNKVAAMENTVAEHLLRDELPIAAPAHHALI